MIRNVIATFFTAPLLACGTALYAQNVKPRVFVLTDLSNEPDDEESIVRFLVYANEYDVEGLVANTSTWLRSKTRDDLIRRQLDAYGQVRPNLSRHAPGFPTDVKLSADKRLATTLVAPVVKKAETVRVICEVKDSGQPALWSYRHAILRVQP